MTHEFNTGDKVLIAAEFAGHRIDGSPRFLFASVSGGKLGLSPEMHTVRPYIDLNTVNFWDYVVKDLAAMPSGHIVNYPLLPTLTPNQLKHAIATMLNELQSRGEFNDGI